MEKLSQIMSYQDQKETEFMDDNEITKLACEIMEDMDVQIISSKVDRDTTDPFILSLAKQYHREMRGALSSFTDDDIIYPKSTTSNHRKDDGIKTPLSLPNFSPRNSLSYTSATIPDFTASKSKRKPYKKVHAQSMKERMRSNYKKKTKKMKTSEESFAHVFEQSQVQDDNEYAIETEYGFLYVKH